MRISGVYVHGYQTLQKACSDRGPGCWLMISSTLRTTSFHTFRMVSFFIRILVCLVILNRYSGYMQSFGVSLWSLLVWQFDLCLFVSYCII